MKARKTSIALPPGSKPRPQVWDPAILPTFRRWAKFHTQLLPYLQAATAEYRRSGLPLIRQLGLVHPDDPIAARSQDTYLLGPDLLAAPVIAPGERTRTLHVPAGRWIDFWRSVRYDRAGDGGLRLRRARTLRGGGDVTLPAPLDELPLLARAGTLLPLLPAAIDTLTDRGGTDVVRYRDRRDRLELLAFPRGRSRAAFGSDGVLRSAETRGRWTLRISARRTRRVALQATLRTLRTSLQPCRITVGGRPLSRGAWSYDRRTGVLRARFRARRARIVVQGACRGS